MTLEEDLWELDSGFLQVSPPSLTLWPVSQLMAVIHRGHEYDYMLSCVRPFIFLASLGVVMETSNTT